MSSADIFTQSEKHLYRFLKTNLSSFQLFWQELEFLWPSQHCQGHDEVNLPTLFWGKEAVNPCPAEPGLSCANSVDPDQLASEEAN